MKYRSLNAAARMLKTFFSHTTKDFLTTEEVFAAWGRKSTSESKNKLWLSSTLLHLKHHELVIPTYSKVAGRHTLIGISLTDKGRSTLNKVVTSEPEKSQPNSLQEPMSYEDILRLVVQFKQDNPQYKVTFNISLKEQ